MIMAVFVDAIRNRGMHLALDQVPDQEHGNQGDCEYAAKNAHAKTLAERGMRYNCHRRCPR